MKKFYALLIARNREFIRDRATLGWNFVFPFLIIFGFAVMFSDSSRDLFKVGVLHMSEDGIAQSGQPFYRIEYIEFIPIESRDEAIHKVSRHKLDMAIDTLDANSYWINDGNPKGYILEKLLLAEGSDGQIAREELEGQEIDYVDWVFPGVLGMNVMFSCLFGVGYVIVRYRKAMILRRLKASPINAFQFLSAQVVSRLIIVMITTAILYFGSSLFIDLYISGSLIDFFIVFLVGSFCLISLGLLVACKTHSQELAGGLLNFVTWPMMFLSGVWFSLEGTNVVVQKLALIFPLTHMLVAARKVTIDGLGLLDVMPELTILLLLSFAFLLISSYLFRWE